MMSMSKTERKPDKHNNKYTMNLVGRALKIRSERGSRQFIRAITTFLYRYIYSYTLLPSREKKTFTFRKHRYGYFYHKHDFTWDSERAVELPIIMSKLESFKGKRILEVGNVTSHYVRTDWEILDKFEKARGVINQDAADYRPKIKYDFIFSISTLEHVGYDDEEKDPKKIMDVLKNLRKNCLKSNGYMIVTMPIGYNKNMDKLLFSHKLGFNKKYYLKRTSKGNDWIETVAGKIRDAKYGVEYPEASAIVIAEMHGTR
jgi:hypothetical protein